jgi:nucleotide-binding universal stress UspA family protein
MTDTFVVGFDGSDSSKRALAFAADRAKTAGANLHLVMVLEWSAYSFHTPEELAERHKRREEELDRANAVIQPAVDELTKAGHTVTCEARHGHAAEILSEIASDLGAVQIIVGRTGSSPFASRMLGSLTISLVQAAPVSVTVVP